MKYLFLLLFIVFLLSCKNNESSKASIQQTATQNENFKQAKKQIVPEKETDTLSFDYFIELADSWEQIPEYLIDSFIGDDWSDENDSYRAFYGNNTTHFIFNGLFVLTFKVTIYGVCSNTVLGVYEKDGRIISQMKVGEGCDADLSSAMYSFSGYEIFADSLIQTYTSITQAVNFAHSLPDSVDDLDDVETTETINYNHFIIRQNGIIDNIRTTHSIYNETELVKLSKTELRFLRNVFFAKYGYIFNSKDLNEYFSKKDWYKPRFEDVTDKLTAFEIYNINLIKGIEKYK